MPRRFQYDREAGGLTAIPERDEAVIADRVMVVSDGGIVLDGTPREVFSEVQLLQSEAQRHIEQNVNAKMVFFDLALKMIMLLKQ